MIIRCETEKNYNHFVLPEINNLEELKIKYANDEPIEAWVGIGTYMYDSNQIIRERLSKCHLYLNNYLFYRDVSSFTEVKSLEEWELFKREICKKCKSYHYSLGCMNKYCKHGKSCYNFEQEVPIIKRAFFEKFKKCDK